MSVLPISMGIFRGTSVEIMKLGGTAIVDIFRPIQARRLVAVRISGQAGDGLLQTALASFVLFSPERAANPAAIALSFGILLLPYSFIGPFVGVFIDRWSRRKILAMANLIRAITMVGLAALVYNHSESAPLALLVIVSLGVNRFLQAALAASIPHVVSNDQLVTANALFPTLGTAGASIAATCGLAVQHVSGNTDTTNAFLICCGVMLAGIASSLAISISPKDLLGPHGATREMREKLRNVAVGLLDGVNKLQSTPATRNAMCAVLLQRFAFGALTVRTLLLARTQWHAGNPSAAVVDFGIAAGSAAAGAFLAALISALVLKGTEDSQLDQSMRHNLLQRSAMYALFIGIVVTDVALSLDTRLAIFLSAGVLAFAGQLLKISADTSVQRNVDDIHRGRVFSLFDMAINFSLVTGTCIAALLPSMMNSGVSIAVLSTALAMSAVILWRNRDRHT